MKRLFIFLLLTTLLISSCGAESEPVNDTDEKNSTVIFAMDTVMELSIYGSDELLTEAAEMVYDLESKLSVTDENSEIYAINRDGTGTLTGNAAEVLSAALDMCSRTDGVLDISIYPVVHEWGFTTGDYKVPDPSVIASLLSNVNYRDVQFDGSSVTLKENMEIDLGSIAKGYTGGMLTEFFRSNGVTSALLNLGGNVQALGSKPDGSDWRVAIQEPHGNGNCAIVSVSDKAVITSGGYERYFVEDGVEYCHIIDPSTGAPARSGLISVSIIGDNGAVCDALSTSLFIMGLEKASQFWRESDDFEAIFITDDNEMYITEGLTDILTPVGIYEDAEVTVIKRD